jgi:hypothetical protein
MLASPQAMPCGSQLTTILKNYTITNNKLSTFPAKAQQGGQSTNVYENLRRAEERSGERWLLKNSRGFSTRMGPLEAGVALKNRGGFSTGLPELTGWVVT